MSSMIWSKVPPEVKCRGFSMRSMANVASKNTYDASLLEKQRLATVRLYRILQRSCRSFPVDGPDQPVLLQPVLKATDWGRHVIYKPPSPTMTEELFRLFYEFNDSDEDCGMGNLSSIDDWYYEIVGKTDESRLPAMTSMTCWTTTKQIQDAIRAAFRVPFDSIKQNNLQFWAIRAVKILHEQQEMWAQSSSKTTHGVRVTATSRCIGTAAPTAVSSLGPADASGILDIRFRFAYRIRVENVSEHSVQLLGRYWCIKELTADGKEDESKEAIVVDSPATGAVGHLPVLRPGQVFEYMSGTDLASKRGVMNGRFYMARVPHDRLSSRAGDHVEALHDAQEKFEAEVAPFPLEASNAMTG